MADSAISLPPSVTIADGNGGLPVVRVATARCSGEVFLDGATVTGWTPTGADPVLFLSGRSHFVAGEPIRGGVPLCGPWFGKGRGNDRTPMHGFFRITRWTLVEAHDEAGTVTLTFNLDGDAAGEAGFPGLAASYTVTFGDELDLALTVRAGQEEIELEEALHTYFRVGDVTRVSIEGLDGARYVDKAPGGRAVNAQSGPVTFLRETDRVYAYDGEATIVDPESGRRIVVAKEGSASTILWNPWEAKAAGLDDMDDAEWKHMVCVESGNVLRQPLTLAAGQAHTLRQHVRVVPD